MIFGQFRDKSILISPNQMHIHYGINIFDYEQRKVKTTIIAKHYLELHANSGDLIKKFDNYERKHDVADSLCFVGYWLAIQQKKQSSIQKRTAQTKRILKFSKSKMTIKQWFDQFKYIRRPRKIDFSRL